MQKTDKLRLILISVLREQKREVLRDPFKYQGFIESTAHRISREQHIDCSVEEIKTVVADLLGYGPVNQLLINNKDITEVQITNFQRIYYEKEGVLLASDIKFENEHHLRTLAEKIALVTGRRLDESAPYLDTKLPDGTRVNITIPPVAARGTTISFRRFPKTFSAKELVESETLSSEAYEYTKKCITEGGNIVTTGGMSTGKTTLLNAFIDLVGEMHGGQTSIVTYEDTLELQPIHDNLRQFESRPPNIEGKGEISIKHLAQTQMLRTRADWIILGESRGAEAYYIISMMCVGHNAMSSFHAFNPSDAVFYRVPSMILMSEEGKSEGRESALSRTATALDVIFQCAKITKNGRVTRQVVQIAEVLKKQVNGVDIPEINTVFEYQDSKLVQVGESKISQKRKRWV